MLFYFKSCYGRVEVKHLTKASSAARSADKGNQSPPGGGKVAMFKPQLEQGDIIRQHLEKIG